MPVGRSIHEVDLMLLRRTTRGKSETFSLDA